MRRRLSENRQVVSSGVLDLLCGCSRTQIHSASSPIGAAFLWIADQSNESMLVNMIEDRTDKAGANEIAARREQTRSLTIHFLKVVFIFAPPQRLPCASERGSASRERQVAQK